MTYLPLEKKPRWFATELAATIFAGLPPFLTAIGGIGKGVHDREWSVVELGIGVLVATIIGIVFKAGQARRKDAKEAAKQSHQDLEGCLFILHASILAMRHLPYDDHNVARLRVTIHRVLDDEDKVLQLTPYVGGGNGKQGRKFSRRSGITGRAILRGKPAAMIRDGSFDDYVQLLVDEYHMPIEEARALSDDRFAFLAVPLKQSGTGRVVGVVFMDSPDRTFFSDPAHPTDDISWAFVEDIGTACAGLAPYTKLRYPSEGSDA
jgi:hypothetical protein